MTARSTETPSGPISCANHGLWSVPTAWWWVIVAPAAIIASLAAVFAFSHCVSPSAASFAATVK